jgi:hypothetical protein
VEDLGIMPDFVWKDDQGENIFWVNKFFHLLKSQGYILKEKADIMRCACGIVESLAKAENISSSRRLYRKEYNKNYCKFCNDEVVVSSESVYFFRFPDLRKSVAVFPEIYEKELANLIKKFSGFKFLISRRRKSALAIWTGEENIFLDVDFIWQMFLPLLCQYGYRPEFLVGGTKNLMACCFAMVMLKLISDQEIKIIIPPYYLAPRRQQLKGEKYLIKALFERYDTKTVRLFLATAMNWKRKESVLDFNLLNLISKMSYRLHSAAEEAAEDIIKVTRAFESGRIKILLSEAKKERENFYYKELFGII